MPNDASNTGFQSVLAPFMDRFLQEKHTCGYAYHEPIRILHRFDEFLVQEALATLELPRSIVRNWLAKKPHESAATQQQRITIVRQFTKFLLQTGYPAYVPDSTLGVRKSTFVPRMLTDEELRKIFHAVDTLEPTARSPLRHLVMPEVFRLLYGCGFRVREVLKLRVRDRRPQSRHHHSSTRKVPQRPVGSSRLIGGPPIAKVCRPFRKAAVGCILLPWTQRRAFRFTHRLHTFS
jgi:site-specific recombinase XerD